MAIYFYHSSSHDALDNLALELAILRGKLPEDATDILLSYENSPSIIIGRFQNPWLECNILKVNELKIPIYRRVSGGGTVYHDFGNLNFSIISTRPNYQRSDSLRIMVETLAKFNKFVLENDRFDLYHSGHKISGSAMRKTKDRWLHHFTLLGCLDYSLIADLLHAKKSHTTPHDGNAIKSVHAGTTSLFTKKEWNSTLAQKIIYEFFESFAKKYDAHLINLTSTFDINSNRLELASRHWRFGETPPFLQEVKLEDGTSIVYQWNQGKIVSLERIANSKKFKYVFNQNQDELSELSKLENILKDYLSVNDVKIRMKIIKFIEQQYQVLRNL